MKKSTLCFCLREAEVLLAMKKRGFGTGKWNGYGGKVAEGETPRQAAVRELKEESSLVTPEDALRQVAIVRFSFADVPVFECHVFTTDRWENEPIETEEMAPKWYPLDTLPYEGMWVADSKWIPLVLAGETIEADVDFNEDGSALRTFRYTPARF